uniref:Serpentine receptor class gamma n=1 Tax=Caenorhabditis tropicalis TaxID=1561998 RepID=A0A1I7TY01_9PELO
MTLPLAMLLFPYVYGFVSVFLMYQNFAIINLMVTFASLHGLFSTITMILVHHPYRQLLLSLCIETKLMYLFEKEITQRVVS